MIPIRRAAPDDAAALADLATRTFTDTFAAMNTPENMASFLSSNYSAELQHREILNPDIDTLLAYADSKLAGFAQVRIGSSEPSVTAPDQIELWRFYVAAEWLGRGVAQKLMAAVEQAARQRGKTTLWLGVWEHNPRAIAFYIKCGFRTVGQQIFNVGADAQIDLVMVREIQAPSPWPSPP